MLIDKNVQSRLSKLAFPVFIFFQNLIVGLWRLKKKQTYYGMIGLTAISCFKFKECVSSVCFGGGAW